MARSCRTESPLNPAYRPGYGCPTEASSWGLHQGNLRVCAVVYLIAQDLERLVAQKRPGGCPWGTKW